ncbi:hypothetical protein ABK046_46965, partial [Streptomyces caeruleatus]
LIWRSTVANIAYMRSLLKTTGIKITNNTDDITLGAETLIGNSLFVSKSGNNATAVRGDLVNHYLTIASALAAAQSGDTVFVFPGTYTESG